jgi:hypothetical protein
VSVLDQNLCAAARFTATSISSLRASARLTYSIHHGAAVLRTSALLHALDAPVADWSAAADELIGAGVTRIARDRVAAVLAELADGTAPSTVARKVGVGYSTVARIAETTKHR